MVKQPWLFCMRLCLSLPPVVVIYVVCYICTVILSIEQYFPRFASASKFVTIIGHSYSSVANHWHIPLLVKDINDP